MAASMWYPDPETIIFVNRVVTLMSNRKADQYKLLKPQDFLQSVIEQARAARGDLYTKAAVLLRNLVVNHGFASGNKRTAFIVTAQFIVQNGGRLAVSDFAQAERVLRNVRRFSVQQLASWLQGGELDEIHTKEN